MVLVAYSDSEGSDTEPPAPKAPPPKAPKPAAAFQKTEPRKIKVDLPAPPSLPEPTRQDGDAGGVEPPAKRARTAGAFGGFNSFLPAPKRTDAAAQQGWGLKKGVSLRTSSEAAFSRAAVLVTHVYEGDGVGRVEEEGGGYDESGNRRVEKDGKDAGGKDGKMGGEEVKVVGKATRFKPLSVGNNGRKKVGKKPKVVAEGTAVGELLEQQGRDAEAAPLPPPKIKKSLFSVVPQEDVGEPVDDSYTASIPMPHDPTTQASPLQPNTTLTATPTNSLASIAADLNLTPAQRRQLFGRQHGGGAAGATGAAGANITHFNMDSEYAANEQLRQSGDAALEAHRAVKSIAPGKHSLQQLVNNARTNQEGIEDKWAEGRRERGVAGSKYGWGGKG